MLSPAMHWLLLLASFLAPCTGWGWPAEVTQEAVSSRLGARSKLRVALVTSNILDGPAHINGVAAAESANNATAGGALIPLLALGVPGDVVTAVLLGAFLIHGLAPGPQLFAENLDLVYAIFIALLIAALMLPVVGLAAIRLFSKIVMIPRYALYPIISVLCMLGVYGFNSSPTDLWIMLG